MHKVITVIINSGYMYNGTGEGKYFADGVIEEMEHPQLNKYLEEGYEVEKIIPLHTGSQTFIAYTVILEKDDD